MNPYPPGPDPTFSYPTGRRSPRTSRGTSPSFSRSGPLRNPRWVEGGKNENRARNQDCRIVIYGFSCRLKTRNASQIWDLHDAFSEKLGRYFSWSVKQHCAKFKSCRSQMMIDLVTWTVFHAGCAGGCQHLEHKHNIWLGKIRNLYTLYDAYNDGFSACRICCQASLSSYRFYTWPEWLVDGA